jgi:hypothetical protein
MFAPPKEQGYGIPSDDRNAKARKCFSERDAYVVKEGAVRIKRGDRLTDTGRGAGNEGIDYL